MQDEERAAKSLAAGSQTTGSIQRPVRWFVDITSWEPIAMDLRQLVRAFDAGRIDADTLVWRKGMPDWRRLRDVSELAERLVGGEGVAKLGSEALPADVGSSSSEPPPRQAERSRTPPASYMAAPAIGGSGHGASSHGASGVTAPRISSPPPPSDDAGRDRSSLAARGENAEGNNHAGPRSAPRPPSRRGRGKTPSRPNAAPLALSRTVTQTGLESPAEVVARNSTPPPAALGISSASLSGSSLSGSGISGGGLSANGAFSGGTLPGAPAPGIAAPIVANLPANDESGRASAAPVASASGSRARDTRNPTPPGGVRRQSNSDETPAQKPSSVSVPPPPGILTSARSRPRGRRLLAMAAVVFGAVILIKQLSSSTDGSAGTAQQVDSVSDPTQVEKALVPEPKAAGAPSVVESAAKLSPAPDVKGAEPGTTPATASVESPVVTAPVRMNVAASASETAVATGNASPAETGAAAPAPAAAAAPAPTTAAAPAPTTAAAPARAAAAAPAPAASTAPAAVSPVRPAVPVAAAPARPASPPVSAGQPALRDTVEAPSRTARPFDVELATRQFETAAAKAAACSGVGPTRGTGRVRVAIQPWGRVGRVTHLNQDFAETQVGECVMEAFQQIQIPPFDGNSRSIAGDFVIQ